MILNRWTEEQTIIAFNLYCKIPFSKATSTNKDILKIAKIIGRSPNSVKMKIGNFGNFDPELKKRGIVGLSNTSKLDKEIWDKFYNNWEELAYESEKLIARFSNKSLEEINNINVDNLPIGKERQVLVKQRVNQSFFRSTILSSYNSSCCITGLSSPELLEACHIIQWSSEKKHRLNPQNGLCLNNLFHKAYDNNYLSITPDYKIIISDKLFENADNSQIKNFFFSYHEKIINLPERFVPDQEFLDIRHKEFLRGQNA